MNISFSLEDLNRLYLRILNINSRENGKARMGSSDELRKFLALAKYTQISSSSRVAPMYKEFFRNRRLEFPEKLMNKLAVKEFKNWAFRPANREKRNLISNLSTGSESEVELIVCLLMLEAIYNVHVLDEYVSSEHLSFLNDFKFCGHKLIYQLVHYELIYGKIISLRAELAFLKEMKSTSSTTLFQEMLKDEIENTSLKKDLNIFRLYTNIEIKRCEYLLEYFLHKFDSDHLTPHSGIELDGSFIWAKEEDLTEFAVPEKNKNGFINQIGNFERTFLDFHVILGFFKPHKQDSLFGFDLLDNPAFFSLNHTTLFSSQDDEPIDGFGHYWSHFPNLFNWYFKKYDISSTTESSKLKSFNNIVLKFFSFGNLSVEKISGTSFKNTSNLHARLILNLLQEYSSEINSKNKNLRIIFDNNVEKINFYNLFKNELPDFFIPLLVRGNMKEGKIKEFISFLQDSMINSINDQLGMKPITIDSNRSFLELISLDALKDSRDHAHHNLNDLDFLFLTQEFDLFLKNHIWESHSPVAINIKNIDMYYEQVRSFLSNVFDFLSSKK